MGVNRRSFLKFIGGGAVATLATPVIWQGLDDVAIWTQNFPWIPRIPNGPIEYTPVVSKFCPSFSTGTVGMAQGKPVCIGKNDKNPFSLGGVSSFAGTEVQMLYSPSRIRTPMKRTESGFSEISWEEALSLVAEKIRLAKNSIAMISGDDTSSANEVFSAIIQGQQSENYYFMPTERQPAQVAWNSLGGTGLVAYQYDKADAIIAINANIMDTWGLPIRFTKLRQSSSATLHYIGSQANSTFALADTRIMIFPGTEVIFLLGVLAALVKQGYTLPAIEGIESLTPLLNRYTMATAIKETGIKKEQFDTFIASITKAKSPLFIAGSPIKTGTPVATAMLSMLLTTMLAKGSSPLASVALPSQTIPQAMPYNTLMHKDLIPYLHTITEKNPLAVALTYSANPLYGLPATKTIKTAWKSIAFKVAISAFMDETTMESDVILPLSFGMEGIDDAYTPYGADKQYYLQTTKIIDPIYSTRSAVEISIALAKMLGYPIGIETPAELFAEKAQTYNTDMKTLASGTVATGDAIQAPLTTFTDTALIAYLTAIPLKPRNPVFTNNDIYLLPFAEGYMGTDTTSTPPFNVKLIPHTIFKEKVTYAMMNTETANNLLLRDGDTISISSKTDMITAKLYIHEGIVDSAVAVLAGMGHTAFDVYTKNKGINAMRLLSVENTESPVLSSWSRHIVEIKKV